MPLRIMATDTQSFAGHRDLETYCRFPSRASEGPCLLRGGDARWSNAFTSDANATELTDRYEKGALTCAGGRTARGYAGARSFPPAGKPDYTIADSLLSEAAFLRT